MGLLGGFSCRRRRVEANHIIARGGSAKRQGPADIAKTEHGQSPSAEARCRRKDGMKKIQTHTSMIVVFYKNATLGFIG
jgi:hypothetical protein